MLSNRPCQAGARAALRCITGGGKLNVPSHPRVLHTSKVLTGTAAEAHNGDIPEFPSGAATYPPIENKPLQDRKGALKHAKPFSEFLTDSFNRQHDYLRISITERCNLRCLYCMPEEGVPLSPPAHLLTSPEIFYLSSLFVSQGVNKIRLTGGEPTVRRDIIPLMQSIGTLRSKGLRELALTTNGISLHRKLDSMVEAGLTGINLSLDTLDPFQFQIMTRRNGFDAVMKSIDRILEMKRLGANLKLKINCVVMRGMNERDIIPFVELGREQDLEVRFIEYMPFGGNKWSKGKMISYQEMVDIIRAKYPGMVRIPGHKNDTSKTYQVPGFVGKVGFITSMTNDFCGTCNRLRITGDGNLKVCLHGNTEVSLRDLLRKDNYGRPIDEEAFERIKKVEIDRRDGLLSDETILGWGQREQELLEVIGAAVKRKKEKHAGMGELENMTNRPMILIGGPIQPSTSNLQLTPKLVKSWDILPSALPFSRRSHRTPTDAFLQSPIPGALPSQRFFSTTAILKGKMKFTGRRERSRFRKQGPKNEKKSDAVRLYEEEETRYKNRLAKEQWDEYLKRNSKAEQPVNLGARETAFHASDQQFVTEASGLLRDSPFDQDYRSDPVDKDPDTTSSFDEAKTSSAQPLSTIKWPLHQAVSGSAMDPWVQENAKRARFLSELSYNAVSSLVTDLTSQAIPQNYTRRRGIASLREEILLLAAQVEIERFFPPGNPGSWSSFNNLVKEKHPRVNKAKKRVIWNQRRVEFKKERKDATERGLSGVNNEKSVEERMRASRDIRIAEMEHRIVTLMQKWDQYLGEKKAEPKGTMSPSPEHDLLTSARTPSEIPLSHSQLSNEREKGLPEGVEPANDHGPIPGIWKMDLSRLYGVEDPPKRKAIPHEKWVIDDTITLDFGAVKASTMRIGLYRLYERLRKLYPAMDPLPPEIVFTWRKTVLRRWMNKVLAKWRAHELREKMGKNVVAKEVVMGMNDLSEVEKIKRLTGEAVEQKRDKVADEEDDLLHPGWGNTFDASPASPSTLKSNTVEANEESDWSRWEPSYSDTKPLPPSFTSSTRDPRKLSSLGTTRIHPTRRHYSNNAKPTHPPMPPAPPKTSTPTANTPAPAPTPSPPRFLSSSLPHLTSSGAAHMVSITSKSPTHRTAIATGTVFFSNDAPLPLIQSNSLKKGDVLSVARIAGIMAAKKCPDLIPLCHPISLSHVGIDVEVVSPTPGNGESNASVESNAFGAVKIIAKVQCTGSTGVEMEALTAVMGAALTVVDMCKAVDKGMRIQDVRVVKKEGGRSGTWVEEGWENA